MSKEDEEWWGKLVAANGGVDMRLWGLTELSHRLRSREGHDIYHALFELEHPNTDMRVAPPTTVATADPYDLGVAPAAGMPALPDYIDRDIDEELRRRVLTEPFVVVHGASAAGKSRTLWEAARHCFPSHEIAAPEPSAVRALVPRLRRLRTIDYSAGLVLWLDDLHEFVGPGGLHPSALDALLADGVRVLGTLRLESSREITEAGGRAAAVVTRADVVRLDTRASDAERRAFHAQYRQSLKTSGIGEHFVAALRLRNRCLHASDDALALTRLVIDWRRVTSTKSLAKPRAGAMFQKLRGCELDLPLGEASTEVHPGDAIILSSNDGLTVPDYLVDFDDRRGQSGARQREVPIEHWHAFLEVAEPDEAAAIAQSAQTRGASGISEAALEIARASHSPAVRAWALMELGQGRARSDPDDAREFWLAALAEEDPDGVADATELLMEHAAREGEELDDETVDRIRDAIFDSHDERRRADFAAILGRIYEHRGDLETLADLYKTAGDTNVAEIGLTYARALLRAGDEELAAEILDAVLEHAAESTRGRALVLLAKLDLARLEDDRTRADELLEKIVEAFDLAGDEIAQEIMDISRRFDDRGMLDDVMRRLAALGNVSAKLEILMSTPGEPEP